VALLALENHVVKFDFQALLSFDRLQARITSTKSRRFIQVAANDSNPSGRQTAQNFAFRIQQPVSHSLYSSMVIWIFGYAGI